MSSIIIFTEGLLQIEPCLANVLLFILIRINHKFPAMAFQFTYSFITSMKPAPQLTLLGTSLD